MADRARQPPHVFTGEIGRLLSFIEHPELGLGLGLTSDQLGGDPEATVPVGLWYDVVEAATAASGDPFLGLHFGLQTHLEYRRDAGAMRLMILASDTVRVAIDRVARYQRCWNEAEHYEVVESGSEFAVRHAPWGPTRPAHVQLAEKTAAQAYRFIRIAAPGSMPLAVRFPHARRPGCEEIGSLLRCEPEFGHAATEIVFDAAVLDARLPTADATLFRVLDRHLAERVRDVTPASAFADRARKAIADYLHREDLSIDAVAKLLNTSGRTLQRRLTVEQTSFRDLVDEVRRSRALTLLDSGATVRELVALLGYEEDTAFYRAFRRWTAATPEEWRTRATRAC